MALYSQIAFSQLKHPTDKQEMKNVCANFMDSFRLGKFQAALSTSYGKIISYDEVNRRSFHFFREKALKEHSYIFYSR